MFSTNTILRMLSSLLRYSSTYTSFYLYSLSYDLVSILVFSQFHLFYPWCQLFIFCHSLDVFLIMDYLWFRYTSPGHMLIQWFRQSHYTSSRWQYYLFYHVYVLAITITISLYILIKMSAYLYKYQYLLTQSCWTSPFKKI